MPPNPPIPAANRLVEALPLTVRKQLLRTCEPVDLVFGTVLSDPGRAVRHVYFPLTGFISLVQTLDGRPPLEMGLIGNEGMLGSTLVLRVDTSPLRAVVQGAGTALRMPASVLRRNLHDKPALGRALGRYLYVLISQLAQTAACSRFHEIDKRLARWLLMTHDRAHRDQFHLTHQFLADMLGVRRSAVTIAAGTLQRNKIIRYTRGMITVVSRKKLETAACECYAATIVDYNRMFPRGQSG